MASASVQPSADQDAAALQARMLATATASHDLVAPLVLEVESLIARLTPRVKSPILTGLPTFVRSLGRERVTLRRIADDLQRAALTEDELRDCGKKLEPSRVAVGHAHLKWSVLKHCRSLVAINQSFQGSTKESRREQVSRQ